MIAKHSKSLTKYLDSHAEAESVVTGDMGGPYANVVIIPAYNEGPSLDRAVASIPGDNTLAVVVVNASTDGPGAVFETNEATLTRLNAAYPRASGGDGAGLHPTHFGEMLLLDRQLPPGQGVGLARKHGCDVALRLWADGRITSPWLHCTDADVKLPASYFDHHRGVDVEGAAATARSFRHASSEELASACRVYDAWLRYYVVGLAWAQSPYAYHAIGSTMAVNAQHYAAVRGFPRKNAAEDFYLLNKLRKVGTIETVRCPPIEIEARRSERVPFGTGRAMGQALDHGESALPKFDAPLAFRCLAAVLTAARRGIEDGKNLNDCLDPVPLIDAGLLGETIRRLGLEEAHEVARRSSPKPPTQQKAFDDWFDAFRTMKFMHAVRDDGIAALEFEDAMQRGAFLLEGAPPTVAEDIELLLTSR